MRKWIHDDIKVEKFYFGNFSYRITLTSWILAPWINVSTVLLAVETHLTYKPYNFYYEMDKDIVVNDAMIDHLTALLKSELARAYLEEQ